MAMIPRLEIIGSALGDASRTRILCELMDGRAFTGKELACAAEITPQTASAHLKQLQEAGLIIAEKSGRCVYHRIARPEVAEALEALSTLTPTDHLYRTAQGKAERAGVLVVRSCYDHLAGRLGVAIAESLVRQGAVQSEAGHYIACPSAIWSDLGVSLPERTGTKPFARACLDWTERKPHIAGPLGRQIMARALDQSWVNRKPGVRGMTINPEGYLAFEQILGIRPEDLAPRHA